MRNSVIMFCGFRALNAEVCKNLVLAGVSVVIQDSAPVTSADLGGNFFLTAADIGKNVRNPARPCHTLSANPHERMH